MCTCFVEKDNGPPPPPHIPFLFFYKHPRYWHNSYCNYPVVVLLQRYQELHFLGLARSFPQLAQFSPPPLPPPVSPSLSTAGFLVSLGSCFSLVVWQLWLAPCSGTSLNPLPVLFPLACLCVCPRWGHSRRTVGVMRSQTVLNGPNQAVQTNNLLSLQFSHQEQHSVKCQQQNSLMEQGRKNSNRSYIH